MFKVAPLDENVSKLQATTFNLINYPFSGKS